MARETQAATVLRLLRAAGDAGVSAHDLVYRHGITRGAAVVWGLRHDQGLTIDTIEDPPPGDGRQALARYVLREEPPTPSRPETMPCTCGHPTNSHLLREYTCFGQDALGWPCTCTGVRRAEEMP